MKGDELDRKSDSSWKGSAPMALDVKHSRIRREERYVTYCEF
jgi:competence protein ComGF